MTSALNTYPILLLMHKGEDGQSPSFCRWGRWLPTTLMFSSCGGHARADCATPQSHFWTSVGNIVEHWWWCVCLKIGPEQPQVISCSWGLEKRTNSNYQTTFFNELAWSLGFSGGSVVRNLPASAEDDPLQNGNPLQYSCLGSPMDRAVWRAISSMGLQRSWTWQKLKNSLDFRLLNSGISQ